MAHEPVLGRRVAPRTVRSGGASVACVLFVTAMGVAFWAGAIWASQSWLGLSH